MKPVSDQLFGFEQRERPRLRYERSSARELRLDESWLRDAIFENPELVIGPCRVAGLTDDEWYPWQRELRVDVGPIDVLLVSSQGRVAIVETKLATNPELRRRVLAQALDYLVHLPERLEDDLPEIPNDENGQPVAAAEDILAGIQEGDALVIIASDEMDPRVAKLSRGLFSDHLVKPWDLALIDLALYRPVDGLGGFLVVPHLRNVVQSEQRQVVRVVVEGETPSAKIQIERVVADEGGSGRQKWDENRFLRYLDEGAAPGAVRALALRLRELARRFPESVTLAWGTGTHGNMILKRNDGALIQIGGRGGIRFRPVKFPKALGEVAGQKYRQALEDLVPEAMAMAYPLVRVAQAERVAPALFELVRRTLESLEGGDGSQRDGGDLAARRS